MEKYSYSVNETPEKLEISFSGRMETDFINREMEGILAKVKDSGRDVAIDLAGVDYVSSSFFRLCVAAAKAAGPAGRKLTIRRLNPSVKKVFKIAGFDNMIEE